MLKLLSNSCMFKKVNKNHIVIEIIGLMRKSRSSRFIPVKLKKKKKVRVMIQREDLKQK